MTSENIDKNKTFFYVVLLLFLTLSLASLVNASASLYAPLKTTISLVSPQATLSIASGVTGSVGANKTSASMSVTVVAQQTDLLSNWDFNSSLNGWSTYSQSSLTWSSTSNPPPGAYGGAAVLSGSNLNGNFYGYIYQNFSLSTQVYVNMSIRLYIAVGTPSGQFRGVDVSLSVRSSLSSSPIFICTTTNINTADQWLTPTLSCTPSQPFALQPGSYVFVANITIKTKPRGAAVPVTVYIDRVRLFTSLATFSRVIAYVSNSGSSTLYARLILSSTSSVSSLTSASVNIDSASQAITISSGSIQTGATSWVSIASGSSTPIQLSLTMPPSGSAELDLLLEACTQQNELGACIYYPVVVKITS